MGHQLLSYNTVYSHTCVPTLQRDLLPEAVYTPARWRQQLAEAMVAGHGTAGRHKLG